MAFANVTYAGDGGNDEFQIPFEYLSQTHIIVTRDDVSDTNGGEYTINTLTQKVEYVVAPAIGVLVKIQRQTPIATDERPIDFEGGSGLGEDDLDSVALQSIFLAQENEDDFADLTTDTDQTLADYTSQISGISDDLDAFEDFVNLLLSNFGQDVTDAIDDIEDDVEVIETTVGEAINDGINLGAGIEVFKQKDGFVGDKKLLFKTLVAGDDVTITEDVNNTELTIGFDGDLGEVNVIGNVGAGETIFRDKIASTLYLKSLVAGTNVTIDNNANDLTINAASGGEVNTLDSVTPVIGSASLNATKVGTTLRVKYLKEGNGISLNSTSDGVTIKADLDDTVATAGSYPLVGPISAGGSNTVKWIKGGTNVTLSSTADGVTINATGGSGEVNTASYGGGDFSIVKTKVGSDLPFKGFKGGTDVSLSDDGTDITINYTGSGGGDLIDDTSPQLGGTLDTLARPITSSTGDIIFQKSITSQFGATIGTSGIKWLEAHVANTVNVPEVSNPDGDLTLDASTTVGADVLVKPNATGFLKVMDSTDVYSLNISNTGGHATIENTINTLNLKSAGNFKVWVASVNCLEASFNFVKLKGGVSLRANTDGTQDIGQSGTSFKDGHFSGTLFTGASTTAKPSLNLPHGVAPTTPTNGDFWTTTTSAYAQINGSTVDLGATGGGGGGDVVDDTTPQLGGNLDTLGNDITWSTGTQEFVSTTSSGALFKTGTSDNIFGYNSSALLSYKKIISYAASAVDIGDVFGNEFNDGHFSGTMNVPTVKSLAGDLTLDASTDTTGDVILTAGATSGSVQISTLAGTGDRSIGVDEDGKIIELAGGGGGGDLVDDTSPQLGGQLDVLGQSITSSTGDIVFFKSLIGAGYNIGSAGSKWGDGRFSGKVYVPEINSPSGDLTLESTAVNGSVIVQPQDDGLTGGKFLVNNSAGTENLAIYHNAGEPVIEASLGRLQIKAPEFRMVIAGGNTFDITSTKQTMYKPLHTVATGAGASGFRLPQGTAPSSPANGDMWATASGLFIQIAGVTKTVTLT